MSIIQQQYFMYGKEDKKVEMELLMFFCFSSSGFAGLPEKNDLKNPMITMLF